MSRRDLEGGRAFSGLKWRVENDDVPGSMVCRFINIGVTSNSEHAAIACPDKKFFGLQFHPEVRPSHSRCLCGSSRYKKS
jgi:hypothetical protein